MEDVEDEGRDNHSTMLESKTIRVDLYKPSVARGNARGDEADSWSEQMDDASDGTEDAFLPSD
jgi:hypothetical protein